MSLFHELWAENASAAEERLRAALFEAKIEREWFRLSAEQKEALAKIDEFVGKKFVVRVERMSAYEVIARNAHG